ncbi:Uma2 family endonuclease [Hymenobacter sp. ASUV-10]|uniref:Uma2 family endonuclease n=1 Tax=Hymenobacter aranciens TaxID=3063996 RepID=A0ABT9BEU9_9BACT|nr:Uma2 family endonuclease [Hymenobacter sp. ASUV-10]MDO7876173.1 Uma2 family endonuclease [Hymenobacter sp. ASUV-10]
MQTQAIEIIETEIVLEEVMSANHSRLIHRISVALLPYEDRYDIMPELEFELAAGRLKPDVALVTRQPYDWEKDIVRYLDPPVTAIEIISPTQSIDGLIAKIRDDYFSSGVQSAWLVLPAVRIINLYLPNQPVQVVSSGILHDPATGVELDLTAIFR